MGSSHGTSVPSTCMAAAMPPLPLLSPSRFFWKVFQKSERFSATFCGGAGWPFWGSVSGASESARRRRGRPEYGGPSLREATDRRRPNPEAGGARRGPFAGRERLRASRRQRAFRPGCGNGNGIGNAGRSPSPHWREWRSRLSGVQTGIQGNGSAQGTSKGKIVHCTEHIVSFSTNQGTNFCTLIRSFRRCVGPGGLFCPARRGDPAKNGADDVPGAGSVFPYFVVR